MGFACISAVFLLHIRIKTTKNYVCQQQTCVTSYEGQRRVRNVMMLTAITVKRI